ncbi:hypothetical protein OL239_15325 [Arthrobacter sp. ATA002]|uniref:hypothetical protein n=1 Tax=Arthrobacter sp. ATA002 TaxID=2991715 RepID=UPI0022A7084F|nr:hypothetical protein [Arthrobacter sp. ATA002]WAP51221.1 hypothetical protein OL239_15325 [Arthrobacter sp. ATA002]
MDDVVHCQARRFAAGVAHGRGEAHAAAERNPVAVQHRSGYFHRSRGEAQQGQRLRVAPFDERAQPVADQGRRMRGRIGQPAARRLKHQTGILAAEVIEMVGD